MADNTIKVSTDYETGLDDLDAFRADLARLETSEGINLDVSVDDTTNEAVLFGLVQLLTAALHHKAISANAVQDTLKAIPRLAQAFEKAGVPMNELAASSN